MANLNVLLQQYHLNSDGTTTGTPIGLIGTSPNVKVSTIPLNVTDSSNTAVTTLQTSNFTIIGGTQAPSPITAFTVSGGADGNYIITFTSGSEPSASGYFLITVINNADTGNLFVDPSSPFDSNGQAIINYPVSFGRQQFILGQVNQDAPLTNVISSAYNFVKAALNTNCSISLQSINPLQSIILPAANTPVPVQVVVKDDNNAGIQGPLSVTISTQVVPFTRSNIGEYAITSTEDEE